MEEPYTEVVVLGGDWRDGEGFVGVLQREIGIKERSAEETGGQGESADVVVTHVERALSTRIVYELRRQHGRGSVLVVREIRTRG